MRLSALVTLGAATVVTLAATTYLVVNPSEERSLTFKPTLADVYRGEMPSLEWTSSGYDQCFAPSENTRSQDLREWFGPQPTSGTHQVGPIYGQTTYRILCTNQDGSSVEASTTINVVFRTCGPNKQTKCRGGRFDQSCVYSHSNFDDPVVFYGQPGASHEHDYIGADETDAFSTFDTLHAHVRDNPVPTSCTELSRHDPDSPPAPNMSGYWRPSVQVCEGRDPASQCWTVRLAATHVYYFGDAKNRSSVSPIPGFEQIAGDKNATRDEAKQRGAIHYFCGGKQNANGGSKSGYTVDAIPPDCPSFNGMKIEVAYPSCWNGERDSPNHNTHVAYRNGGKCPPGYPLIIPRILSVSEYPIRNTIGRRLRLTDVIMLGGCKDGAMTCTYADLAHKLRMWQMHEDYLYAWRQDRLDLLVHVCLNSGVVKSTECSRRPPPDETP